MSSNQLLKLLETKHNIHFIGIGGISMSALSEILFNKGHKVTGSDIAQSDIIKRLKNKGIEVFIGHSPQNIGSDIDIVINTAAVKDDNIEMITAQKRGIPIFERSVLLGTIMRGYPCPISIAGTHGKTTTTSMVAEILLKAECDPTCLVGGQLSAIGGNIRVGKSEYMVCEACEYVDSFLTLSHKIAVILNIEEDHLDYFSGIEQIKDSFVKFANIAGVDGYCVMCADNSNAISIKERINTNIITYGINNPLSDYVARNIRKGENCMTSFDVFFKDKYFMGIELNVPGIHNVENALCACAVANILKISKQDIFEGLKSFYGIKRRFEFKGKINGADVIDDYAHHPTEISATLAAARTLGYKRIICVFQPHTYSRTEALFDGFVSALSAADIVILSEIYPAREKNVNNTSSKELAKKIDGALFFDNFDDIVKYIKKIAENGDAVFIMGAGDVWEIGEMLLK